MLILNGTNYTDGKATMRSADGQVVHGGRLGIYSSGTKVSEAAISQDGVAEFDVTPGVLYVFEIYDSEGVLVSVLDPVMYESGDEDAGDASSLNHIKGLIPGYSPSLHFVDDNGNPLNDGMLYVYTAGTNIQATTWRDPGHSEENANPIRLNSNGDCVVFLNEKKHYKFVLKDSNGVEVWKEDDVYIPLCTYSHGRGIIIVDDKISIDFDVVQEKLTEMTVRETYDIVDEINYLQEA